MENCVFCKIIKGEIPSYKIYEDENTLAFLDISKDIDGHTLVIPKNHCKNMLDCEDETLSKVIQTVKKVSNHYVNDCGYDGVNILNANNEASGQSVFHLHFHIIPRKKDDNENAWPKFSGAKNTLEDTHNKLKF
ncbi:MAG: HIT family protein [Clostridia bacterium]|nr:HIT family protein [Clostridia bacterium]